MCGLLTFVSARGGAEQHRDVIAAALERLHHRGPDASAVTVVEDTVVSACKRLAVIDVARSNQPLPYPATGYDAGRYVIAFNGMIYNYRELRRELAAEHGAEFATEGDTEVIAAAYHHWGDQAATRLRGMFAIVLYDTHRGTVWGARDPYGMKPLYHLRTDDGLYFASEKKALLPFLDDAAREAGRFGEPPASGAALDIANLSHYLTLQYVPEPGTMHRGIGRVGAGESFSYHPGGTFATRRYAQPRFNPTMTDQPEALYGRIRDVLRESVHAHLRADVPVGAFLSSGIDSTAIVAFAREVYPEIPTFTVGFDVPGYSEVGVAEDSAYHLGVRILPTRVTADDVMAELPRIVWHLDDPVADPAAVPLYFLARTAAQHVTVVLSGDGADELFGGYGLYREPLSLSAVAGLPDPMQRGLRRVAHAIPEGMKGRSFLERGTTRLEERYYGNARIFTEADKQLLMRHYDPAVRYTDVTAPVYAEAVGLDDVTKMQHVDLYTWLRGDILVKTDRMAMAHSLELRSPFLDREVFEVASTIPVELKVPARSDATKFAMRRALDGVVPAPIVNRRKLGFPTPTRVWLAGEMYEWARAMISGSGTGDLLNLEYAIELLDEHKRGDRDNSRKIWTVLVFCVWYAIFVERSLDPVIARNPSALDTKPPVGPVIG
ncbi:MAG TPA: asparagine synthase (glutamine-hydrolyzing) [Micromonosporaceae bacterium]